jgi:hypothetical protein
MDIGITGNIEQRDPALVEFAMSRRTWSAWVHGADAATGRHDRIYAPTGRPLPLTDLVTRTYQAGTTSTPGNEDMHGASTSRRHRCSRARGGG